MYDGHGGHEVALYTSQKLPDFIKDTEAYKKEDIENALIDAFLGFDATIASRDVVTVLKELAGLYFNYSIIFRSFVLTIHLFIFI